MRGPASANKGMALFPRQVAGRTLALCRSDGETIGLTALDADHTWRAAGATAHPAPRVGADPGGQLQVPDRDRHGWLVLTHGVGPMRDYALGALLLDLDEPDRVIAELPGALLTAQGPERDGYVPNVVYSCGGLLHEGVVWIPYGASDTRIGFATVPLGTLIEAMRPGAL